jgi:glycosyltransferase involved in cell wall biosynthesis
MYKKKVCHIASGFLRDDARIFIRQCCTLSDNGYEVTLLVNDGMKDETLNNVLICSHPYRSKGRLFDILFAKKYFYQKAIDINADIYQLHGPELIPLGLKLKKLHKTVFYDAHEDLPRDILDKASIPFFLRGILSFLVEFYLRFTLKKFDHTFSVTPHIVNNLKRATKNVTLITNYPIINSYNNFSIEEYLNRENIICYTGTVYKYSNQENMVSIVKSNPNITYSIVGFIGEKFKKELLKLNDNNSRIKFTPKVNKVELSNILNNAIIGFVVYDYVRNLGYKTGSLGTNKLFEYMLAGIPIICTDFDLWKAIVVKYNCGIIVKPNDEVDLNNAVEQLLNNKELAYKMGQNGRNAVLLEYNWGKEKNKYLEVFLSAL